MAAYVSFMRSNGNIFDNYLMRFNVVASVLLKDVEYVTMRRNANHIVLEKADRNAKERTYHVFHHPRGAAMISLVGLVKRDGAIDKSAFGKRYKVKRDKDNRIYICLNEVVGNVGD